MSSRSISLRKLCGLFLSISPFNLPLNNALLEETLISESIRIALSKSDKEIHILSLKNWGVRKLRCVIQDIDNAENDKFNDVLREGPGPSMEFIGDVIHLSKGYYIPAPTRTIRIGDDKWILISGQATKYFVNLGLNIEVIGISRTMSNISKEELDQHNIPIQPIYSYVGLDRSLKMPKDFIKEIIKTEKLIDWPQNVKMKAYGGKINGEFDRFHKWGSVPMYIPFSTGNISFWREEREWNQYDYWLKKEDKNSSEGIRIHPQKYKVVCIALDQMIGKPRSVDFSIDSETTQIKMSFSPPRVIIRWLHAIGAQWLGSAEGSISWKINNYAISKTEELMSDIGLNIKKKKQGD